MSKIEMSKMSNIVWNMKINCFSFFLKKPTVNLFTWKTDGIISVILLFKNLLNIDQHILKPVFEFNYFFAIFEYIYLSDQ